MSDNDRGCDICISEEARNFLADILVNPGPALIPESNARDELLNILLNSAGLSAERRLKLTVEIQRSAQQTFQKSVSVDVIIQTVVNYFPGVTKEDLMGESRSREVNRARHISMLLIAKLVEPRPSYKEIAEKTGRKDHTTTLSAISSLKKALVSKPYIREEVKNILKSLSYKYEDVFGAV